MLTPASTSATAPATTRRSASATPAAAAPGATAAAASTWSVPSSGMSQNAAANVPAIEPAVESAKRRPAVRPRLAVVSPQPDRDRRDRAEEHALEAEEEDRGEAQFRRGPGSQSTTRSRIQSSTYGIASTSSAEAPRMPTSRRAFG